MKSIEFIPKEYGDIKLGFGESYDNMFTPPNAVFLWNEMAINAPQKIICNLSVDTFKPVIPVCGAYILGSKRAYKYWNLPHMFHIRKKEEDTWYSGEIVEPLYEIMEDGTIIYEHPAPDPFAEEWKVEIEKAIQAAQYYSDDELNEGQQHWSGSNLNFNLMEFVDFPFEAGIYEIYMSLCGLESNHVEVEIVLIE